MNNWKDLTITNEKYKKIILIAFLAIIYLIECHPITHLFCLFEETFENYFENMHLHLSESMYYGFKVFEADIDDFSYFFHGVFLSVLYLGAPIMGLIATYFGKKFFVYISEAILFVLFIFTCIGCGVYEDELYKTDVTVSVDTWFVLIAVILILVLLLMDSNVIAFNKTTGPVNMNQNYNGYNQNNYMAQNPQMNNPYMAQNPQMNGGYMPNQQMAGGFDPNAQMNNGYAAPNQMYNGYDPNNGGN